MAYIFLKVKENDCPVFGCLDIRNMLLDGLSYWDFADENWKEFQSLDIPSPIYLISVPSILGQAAVEFVVNENKESARIYKHTIP